MSVHSLRPPDARASDRLRDWDLQKLPTTHNTIATSLCGVLYGIRKPKLALELVVWVVLRTWSRPPHLLRSLVAVPRALDIFRRIVEEQPDVVHLFWGHYPSLVGRLVQTHLPDTVLSLFLGAYDLEIRHGCSGPVARAADVVWTHAHANVPDVIAMGVAEERIEVAYRGTDSARTSSVRIRRTETAARLVSVGRLAPEKGMDDSLRVFAAVRRRHPHAVLTILGDGRERERLEAIAHELGIEDVVHFRGMVSNRDVLEELASANVFLFMSTRDILPNVAKEAMALGCPCVITRTHGMDELVVDGEHGIVVEARDVDSAVAAVDRLLADPRLRARMGAAAREHIARHFDADATMRKYIRAWENIVEGGARASDEPAISNQAESGT